jgi:bifunctional DNase/RNase
MVFLVSSVGTTLLLRAVASEPAFGAGPGASSTSTRELVETEVMDVLSSRDGSTSLVLLGARDGRGKLLPVFTPNDEALAIVVRLHEGSDHAPQLADLVRQMIERLGGSLRATIIDEPTASVVHGRLVVVRDEQEPIEVLAPAPQSIAVALAAGAPVYVSKALLESAGVTRGDPRSSAPETSGKARTRRLATTRCSRLSRSFRGRASRSLSMRGGRRLPRPDRHRNSVDGSQAKSTLLDTPPRLR